MTQKTKKKEEKLFTAAQVCGLCGINVHLRFAAIKKYGDSDPLTLFGWACIFIDQRILEKVPDTLFSLLSSQQVKDLSDLLK